MQFLKGYTEIENKYADQQILMEIIVPVANSSILAHDSFHCGVFSNLGKVVPFPTRRKEDEPYNFVGSQVDNILGYERVFNRPRDSKCIFFTGLRQC